jgi:hypothetical protein
MEDVFRVVSHPEIGETVAVGAVRVADSSPRRFPGLAVPVGEIGTTDPAWG